MLEAVARRVREAFGGHVRGPQILLYHRVAESPPDPFGLCVSPRHFGEHLEVLERECHPMPLAKLVAAARTGDVPDNAVAVTFDDGYCDNLASALPLLARHGIPATFLVASGQVGASRGFWWDELERIVLRASRIPAALTLRLDDNARRWDSHGDWDAAAPAARSRRSRLFHDLYAILIVLPQARREALLDELLRWADVAAPAPESDRALTAGELAALAASPLAAIGAHTVSHPMLTRLARRGQVHEMRSSRERLEDIVAVPVTSFAYPYGDHDDRSVAAAREAGFDIALTCVAESLAAGDDPLKLPRLEVHDCDGEGFVRALARRRFAPAAA